MTNKIILFSFSASLFFSLQTYAQVTTQSTEVSQVGITLGKDIELQ